MQEERRLVLGVFILFMLVSSHLCGFIYMLSFWLVTFRWGLSVDILFVDDAVISFCFLVFLLTVRPLCYRTAGGPLHTLLSLGSPAVAAEQ